ncbi:hypothetical protein P691DRAFT_785324 [Macrolepiota fuliginosa MF-IS2]|uniref:Ricin B lectin domain-containing protein n=1 Tax=Macrolepiota fuliginosa MF-IS2 TaxID=1400762 RepID=A0A9P6BYN4_9AGAR|nr:hypothetical protein P691DRAFT_785324 [Macrolepiota fuliginosa MF-IS2]
MFFWHQFSVLAMGIALFSGSGLTAAEVAIGPRYTIRSTAGNRPYVASNAVGAPLKLVESPSPDTIWSFEQFESQGRLSIRSSHDGYAFSTGAGEPIFENSEPSTPWSIEPAADNQYKACQISTETGTFDTTFDGFWTVNDTMVYLDPESSNFAQSWEIEYIGESE